MKKLLVLVFAIALCLGALCLGASADHLIELVKPEGAGTEDNPYKISQDGHLYWFADYVNDGHPNACAVMTQDIYINVNVLLSNGNLNDVPPNEWIPINNFSGTFDGQGYTIHGLYLSDTSDGNSSDPGGYYYTGMFRDVSGTVKNLKLEDSYVAGEFTKSGEITKKCNSVIGGICGVARAGATVSGCSFDGSLSAVTAQRTNLLLAGGICGYNMGQLENCSFDGTLTAANNSSSSRYEAAILSYGGGICGTNTGTVKDCTNRGTIKGEGYNPVAGGICGEGSSNTGEGTGTTSLIENCDNYGQVTAITEGGDGNTCYAGGILGYGSGEIIDCKNNAKVLGANYAGGIAGAITNGEITGCTNTEKVEGYYQYVGGICGYVSSSVTIKECTNSGDIKLTDTSYGRATGLGGICGGMSDEGITIMNCHNTGNLTGHQDNPDTMYIGGICGRLSSGTNLDVYILNCCNTGIITSSSPQGGNVYTGGVCGVLVDGVKFENCFWLDLDGSGDEDTGAMTAERFERGEAAGPLNRWSKEGYNGKVWGLGEDGYPVLTDVENTIVKVDFVDFLDNNVLMTCYTNPGETLKGIDSIVFDEGTTLKIDDEKVDDLQSMSFGKDTTIVVDGGLRYVLTATVTGSTSKEYDGTNTVKDTDKLILNLSGIMTGDDVSASVQYIFDSADTGIEKAITAKSVTLNGKDAGKYVLDVANVLCSGVTGNIARKELTASISGSVTKVYDGNTYVPDGLSITLEGVIPGDKDNVTATATYTFDSADAGEGKTINASDITLSGADAGNYVLSATTVSGSVGTITKKTLTPSISGTVTKVYNGTTDVPVGHGLSITLEGVVGNDEVFATAAYAFDDANVGQNKTINATGITLIGADAGNYVLSATEVSDSVGAITLKKVVITAEDKSAYMGDAMPELSYKVEGFLDGDGLTAEPVLRCDAYMIKAGTYEITVSGGAANSNYELSYKSGTLTVKLSWVMTVRPANGAADVVYYVHPGESFTLPDAPSKAGYIFLGWRSGDTTYRAEEEVDITSNMSFTAVWGNLPDIDPEEPEPEPELPFYDVAKGDWFYDAVYYVWEKGLMDGVEEHIFAPNETLTRAMVWTIIARAEGVDTDGGATWYAKAQAWVVAKGISDGENPSAAITRQELVTMLWRLSGEPVVNYTLTSPDADAISGWAYEAMRWAVSEGIIEGDDLGNLNPTANSTRAHAAAFMQRFCTAL